MPGAYEFDSRISPDSPINYSNSSPNSQSEHGVQSNESIHVSEGYEPISISFPDFPIQQQDEHYMVLYDGNAEVVGNFRALNFYKASDINIKEDIRLLSEDHDCRDTLMRINGVDYKFKPGVHDNVNRRFVGYIAQQVESVVPSAVQLIDGILHVDYESLIPYLSESIRQNFNDIKNIKADYEKIYQAIDSMYEVFIDKDTDNPSSITPLIEAQTHKKKRYHSKPASLGTKILIICMAVVFVVAGAFGLYYWQHMRTSVQTNPEAIPASPIVPVKLPIQPLQPTIPISPQRQALQALYLATNGKYWTKQDNWLSDKSLCTWYGIQCSMFGEDVVVMVLDNNNLNGTIPESIQLLSGLRGLNLAFNNLHGTIPESIYNLTQILQIDLTFNNLVGTISPNVIQFTLLHSLQLSGNKLTGTIPIELTYMTRISKLTLRSNCLSGTIPPFKPGTLEELYLGSNRFVGTLPDFSEFEDLEALSVEHNQLEGTIPMLPSSLRIMFFAHNRFNGTVEAFDYLDHTMTSPMKIDIGNNQFTGDVGPLMQYPALVFLNASGNNFTTFSTMVNSTNPGFQCHMSSNQFACPLPPDADRLCGATCT